MSLRLLTDTELCDYARNTLGDVTSTVLERELLAELLQRFEALNEWAAELAQEIQQLTDN